MVLSGYLRGGVYSWLFSKGFIDIFNRNYKDLIVVSPYKAEKGLRSNYINIKDFVGVFRAGADAFNTNIN